MHLDFYTATADELRALGWPRWTKESDLYLCPLSQFSNLPDGIALHSIGGDVKVKGRDYIDDDTRGGMLAYGIVPGKTTTATTATEVATIEAARRAAFTAQIAEVCAENGLIDMGTGRVLRGDEAAKAIFDMNKTPED